MVSHLRNWIHLKAGGGVKWGAAAALQPLPSRLQNKDLFDVYDAHTKQCSLCMTAVKNTTNRLRIKLGPRQGTSLESRWRAFLRWSGNALGEAERLLPLQIKLRRKLFRLISTLPIRAVISLYYKDE